MASENTVNSTASTGKSKEPSPVDLQTLFSRALSLHQAGKLSEAEKVYLQVLERMPASINLLCNLGVLYRDMKNHSMALTYLQRAAALDPDNPMIALNIGAVLEDRKDLRGAVAAYRKALKASPHDPRILNNLGKALYLLGETAAALDSLNRAVKAAPDYPLAQNNLGVLLAMLGRNNEAIDCFTHALAATPGDISTLYNLAGTLNTIGRTAEAENCYRQVLAIDPGHAPSSHMLAAITGVDTDRAPADYVTDTFDRYAAHFEHQLTENLGYQIPSILSAALKKATGTLKFGNALDLGCGTGLSGKAFHHLTAKLTGVDLSAGMLEEARAKGIYLQLIQEEIVTFLNYSKELFDLFIATDVFIYIGDLAPVFAALKKRAAQPAYLVFSIESMGNGRDYELRPSGRYAQSIGYIEKLAKEFGFSVIECQEQNIRREQGEWINGAICIIRINHQGPF